MRNNLSTVALGLLVLCMLGLLLDTAYTALHRPAGQSTTRLAYAAVPNVTGTNPLCSTGSSLANGLACKTDAGAHVRACHFVNTTDSGAWVELADLTVAPTTYSNTLADAGNGPGMVGDPFYIAANSDLRVGTDFFGVDGWLTGTGFSVGVSTTAPGDAGTFTAAGASFQITCNGQ